MLGDWVDSVGAGIEYDVAVRTGKVVLFETNTTDNQKSIKIQKKGHGMNRYNLLKSKSDEKATKTN
jgi:hypothetical protein